MRSGALCRRLLLCTTLSGPALPSAIALGSAVVTTDTGARWIPEASCVPPREYGGTSCRRWHARRPAAVHRPRAVADAYVDRPNRHGEAYLRRAVSAEGRMRAALRPRGTSAGHSKLCWAARVCIRALGLGMSVTAGEREGQHVRPEEGLARHDAWTARRETGG